MLLGYLVHYSIFVVEQIVIVLLDLIDNTAWNLATLQEMGSVPGWRKGIAVGQAGVAWLSRVVLPHSSRRVMHRLAMDLLGFALLCRVLFGDTQLDLPGLRQRSTE